MPPTLPQCIADYFAGANKHDIDATLATFGENALVTDEGEQHSGIAAIREWIEDTTAKYRPAFVVKSVSERAGNTIVLALVSGTFPGSPIEIGYEFTIKNEKIAGVEIR